MTMPGWVEGDPDLVKVVSTYRCGCVVTEDDENKQISLVMCADGGACKLAQDFKAKFPGHAYLPPGSGN
jgi:hypothetical protein